MGAVQEKDEEFRRYYLYMARYTDAKCRLCRRAGIKLMLKGDRCLTSQCAMERRKFPPGQKPKRGVRISNYLLQIKEKQKLKRMYGLVERQFKNIFDMADKKKGGTGDNFISLLERRLDNVVFRACFASSRQQARQIIRHGHIYVNGRKVNIPSYFVKAGDVLTIKERSRKLYPILKSMGKLESVTLPEWIAADSDNFTATVVRLPERGDVDIPIEEHLIIELYSKV